MTLPPLSDAIDSRLNDFAKACVFSDQQSRVDTARQLKLSIQEYARKAQREAVAAAVPEQPRLTVRLTCFPESNGKTNWTALLVRADKWDGLIGNCGGISLARGELWNRVAWEAECARFLIGERDTEPFILDYGDDIKTPEEWAGEVGLEARMKKKAVLAAAPGGER